MYVSVLQRISLIVGEILPYLISFVNINTKIMTGTFQKISDELYTNSVTGYKIEYWDKDYDTFHVGTFYVLFDKDNFVVWEFETLESAIIAAEEHYQSELEWNQLN
jgi:hypothetical protein